MSTRILPDLAAAFANLKNADHVGVDGRSLAPPTTLLSLTHALTRSFVRQVTLVLHEVDEGTKQPHDSASYNETDECSRAYQLLSAPPRAGFPEFTCVDSPDRIPAPNCSSLALRSLALSPGNPPPSCCATAP